MKNFEHALNSLLQDLRAGDAEVYNEVSLQHELGIKLRETSNPLKVQFERNISYFFTDQSDFVKREIDISVFDCEGRKPYLAVELKYPRNGQVPEQMFNFCKDIVFVEQLVRMGFRAGAVLIFADDRSFYSGASDGIYGFFRAGRELHGPVAKPTGKKDEQLIIHGRYTAIWQPILGHMSYTLIRIGAW